MATRPPAPGFNARRGGFIAALAAGLGLGMLALSFAAVPLYRLFCAATGYGGVPRVAQAAPAAAGQRELVVRFDANVAPGLNWRFEPETPQITLRTGKTATVYFKVSNLADRAGAAQATYNVGPDSAAGYFNKLNCFCFTAQRLEAHETADMPVVFFLDPALEQDRNLDAVESVTLSYTFFAARAQAPLAAGETGAGKKPL